MQRLLRPLIEYCSVVATDGGYVVAERYRKQVAEALGA
jgi:hypothetical protein